MESLASKLPGARSAVCLMALALLLYLLFPLLRSTHFEAASAQVMIVAVALNAGLFDQANVLYPLHSEFFYFSRPGVVYLLRLVMHLVGTGDVAFRALVGVSWLALLASSVAVAHRWASVIAKLGGPLGRGWFLLVLMATPLIADLGFYFNDNVVSAAFAVTSLWLASLRPAGAGEGPAQGLAGNRLCGLASGMAMGFAVLCRPDAAVVLPLAAGIGWLNLHPLRRLVVFGACFAAAFVCVLLVFYGLSGVSIWTTLQIGLFFDRAVNPDFRRFTPLATVFVLGFGLPNLVLLPLGIWRAWVGGDWRERLVFIGLPLLIASYMVRTATETRYFYPLVAPFVALYGVLGLRWLLASLRQRGARRALAVAWCGLFAVVWLAPPLMVPVRDGPRPVVGRLWAPLLWLRWQAAMERTLGQGAATVARAEGASRSVVLTTHINPDHFLRLRLWQAGWLPEPIETAWPGCKAFEVWRRKGREVDHVRTENPHLTSVEPYDYLESLQIQQAFACAGLVRNAPFFLYNVRDLDSDLMRSLYAAVPGLAQPAAVFSWPLPRGDRLLNRLGFGTGTEVGTVVELTPVQVTALAEAARRSVAARRNQAGSAPPLDYDGVMAAFASEVWKRSPPRSR